MSQEHGQQFLLALPGLRHDLPYSPALLTTLYSQTGQTSSTPLEEIADTLSRDQGLTAKVLTMANSAFYGLQQEVTTVPRAIAVLGLNEVRSLVLAVGVKALTQHKNFPKEFGVSGYWQHQLSVAIIARHLAPLMGSVDADNLFTAGVLHDLGKLLTALHRSDDWRAIDALTREQRVSYSEAEEDYWGIEHGVLGSMVLGAWNLPEDITEPVNWHHAPMHSPNHRREALVLCVADAMAHVVAEPEAFVHCPWRDVLGKFHLSDSDMLEQVKALLLQHDPGLFAAGLAA
ncbi:HDOD domain-containing protein [Fundidesulfovibrio putealis]|uniref:HDOD domain-containing protein n=1 Tax=Fundidesulfovibrio putealis TaxID=270496 RepID=UPI00040AB7E2|nr:HDOD domain-containing protein [Fundidesulfovibrio putealis]